MSQSGTSAPTKVATGALPRLLANRWWIYQKERFPLAAHTPAIAAFSASAVTYSILARDSSNSPEGMPFVVAFVSSFLLFLQLRLADEFKDFEEDARYRSYRPVPRGLVTLQELAFIWCLCIALQFLLALLVSWRLLPLLAITLGYVRLMSKEFFVPTWLKGRPMIYMLSHMVIMPLMFLYASACEWISYGYRHPPHGLGWMLVANFFLGIVIEIGRKIRAPADEEIGVETYSFLWGRRNAVLAWLVAITASALVALPAARVIHLMYVLPYLLVPVIIGSAAAGFAFLIHSNPGRGKWIETISGIWILLMYLSLGPVPALLRWHGVQK